MQLSSQLFQMIAELLVSIHISDDMWRQSVFEECVAALSHDSGMPNCEVGRVLKETVEELYKENRCEISFLCDTEGAHRQTLH